MGMGRFVHTILIEQTLPARGGYYSPMSGARCNMGQTCTQGCRSELLLLCELQRGQKTQHSTATRGPRCNAVKGSLHRA